MGAKSALPSKLATTTRFAGPTASPRSEPKPKTCGSTTRTPLPAARILDIAAWMAVLVSGSFVAVQLLTGSWLWQVISINIAAALVFAFVPMLHRFGELVAPLTFIFAAYATVLASCWDVGTGSGAQCSSSSGHVWPYCCWVSSTSCWPVSWRRSAPGW